MMQHSIWHKKVASSGNGRTGRIVNVLYLVKQGLLDIPVPYMSRYIVRTKNDYYRLLQSARAEDAWEAWVEYMLTAIEHSAIEAIATINAILTGVSMQGGDGVRGL